MLQMHLRFKGQSRLTLLSQAAAMSGCGPRFVSKMAVGSYTQRAAGKPDWTRVSSRCACSCADVGVGM
jgi:hypothetical protein